MNDKCLFCKIAAKEMDTKFDYEDEEIVAFRDINPKAPVHLLIIPKKHISSVNEMTEEDAPLIGKLIFVAKKLAVEKGISESGYRLVFNTNKDSGQIIDHIHLHLLGGEVLGSMV